MTRIYTPHLWRRGDVFYFRMAVPQHLRGRVGGRDIATSLKTRDFAVARQRCRVLSNSIETLFQRLLLMPDLTRYQIQSLIRSYFQHLYREEIELYQPDVEEDYSKEEAVQVAIEDAGAKASMVSNPQVMKGEKAKVAQICAKGGIKPDGLSQSDFRLLLKGLREAEARIQAIYAGVLQGKQPYRLITPDPEGVFTLESPLPVASKVETVTTINTKDGSVQATSVAQPGDGIMTRLNKDGTVKLGSTGEPDQWVVKAANLANLYTRLGSTNEYGDVVGAQNFGWFVNLPKGGSIVAPWGGEQHTTDGVLFYSEVTGEVYLNEADGFATFVVEKLAA